MVPTTVSTLVIVDSAVKNYHSLISRIDITAAITVLVLHPSEDGIEQITQALDSYRNLCSLHLVSHGKPGSLQLGSTQLSIDTISHYANALRQWNASLAANAEILLYGCEVAAGAAGQSFIHRMSQLTGANLAASTTPIGNAALGGDWILDARVGQVNSSLAFAPEALVAYPGLLSTVLLEETFTGSTVLQPSWLIGVGPGSNSTNPFLTAGTSTTVPPGGIPGLGIDTPGNGALRLTSAGRDEATFAIYNVPTPSNAGLAITFDLFAYGGDGADGISFFLIDGDASPTQAGGFGGSLGYAPRNFENIPGLVGGYLGIGFDEFGNFSSRENGQKTTGPARRPDSIAVRGSEALDYAYLTGTTRLTPGIDTPGEGVQREQARRRVQITLNTLGFLNVSIDLNDDGDFDDEGEEAVQDFDVVAANNGLVPDTFKFGFAASTGDNTNIHEIRNFLVRTLSSPPDTLDLAAGLPPSSLINLPVLTGIDTDGTVTAFRITTLPPVEQGTLFLGDPQTGGAAVTAGQVIPLAQANQLFFLSSGTFAGTDFSYAAIDSDGATDATPATVTLNLVLPGQSPPVAQSLNVRTDPDSVIQLPPLSAVDSDGFIASFTILTLPPAAQGTLFLGDPDDEGVPVAIGQVIPLNRAGDLFFRSTTEFDTNVSFLYSATDNTGLTGQASIAIQPQSVEPVPGEDGCLPGITVRGTAGDDVLRGTANSDVLFGLAGDDRLIGLDCGDILRGAEGNDILYGGADRDRLFGNQGNDFLDGGTGDDSLNGGAGDDRLFGREGKDRLDGGAGNDVLYGGEGDDIIRGQLGDDLIWGDEGDDVLFGQAGRDIMYGGTGNDSLNGGSGDDELFGQQGNDRLDGGAGDDVLNGGEGDDILRGQAGDDIIRGGAGVDILFGHEGDDILNGGEGDDSLSGLSGDDRLFGESGNDRVDGGSGNDVLYGNDGDDILLGGQGNDILIGGAGNDDLTGDTGSDTFVFNVASRNTALANLGPPDRDRVRDFNFSEGDKFQVRLQGTESLRPTGLFNAGTVTAANLLGAVRQAYADKNQRVAGAQRLAANEAVFFTWGAQTFLAVNDEIQGFGIRDLLIDTTGIQFRAGDRAAGTLTVSDYFV